MGYDDNGLEWEDDWEDYENLGPGGPLPGSIPLVGIPGRRAPPLASKAVRAHGFVNTLEPGIRIQRGRSETLLGVTPAQATELINIQGPNADPVELGVHLSAETLILGGGGVRVGSTAGVIAIVEWGVDGTTHTAQVSFTNGTSFAVVASSLRISAFKALDFDTTEDVVVKSSVAWGGVFPGECKPIRSFSIVPPPGFPVDFRVPPFAQTLDVRRAIFGVSYDIEEHPLLAGGGISGTILSTTTVAGGTDLPRRILLSTFTSFIRIFSAGVVGRLQLTFGLNL